MSSNSEHDAWSAGKNYEHYMGRWSRQIAERFVEWLGPPENSDWLEVGCGTGALTKTVLAQCSPCSILAIDQSAEFVSHAKSAINDGRIRFETADAQQLPAGDGTVDVAASALVLNFIPDKAKALREMQRTLRPGGILAFYVWDYPGGGVGFIDAFWKAAAELDSRAAELDESRRFPFCTRDGLVAICRNAGLRSPEIAPIEIKTEFTDFEAFWHPFTLGAGPAPGYCMSLTGSDREKLKSRLAETLGTDRAIVLPARAWGIKCQNSS